MASGLLVGADTDTDGSAAALAGAAAGVLLIVLNAMALAQFGAARLNAVPLRVAGSWIAAAAALLLALLLRTASGAA